MTNIPKAAPMDVGFWLGYCGKDNGGSLYSEYGLIPVITAAH
jgi:hypothetical protein